MSSNQRRYGGQSPILALDSIPLSPRWGFFSPFAPFGVTCWRGVPPPPSLLRPHLAARRGDAGGAAESWEAPWRNPAAMLQLGRK